MNLSSMALSLISGTVALLGLGLNTTKVNGRFEGATGTLTLSENTIFDPNATMEPSTTGTAVLTGSFTVAQKVPEAGNTKTIFGIGIIGAGLLLHKRHYFIGK